MRGRSFEGGAVPGAPPDWPPAARLAPGKRSVLPTYASADAFVAMMCSGKRPHGSENAVMPFASLKIMTETDLRALHLFLPRQPGG